MIWLLPLLVFGASLLVSEKNVIRFRWMLPVLYVLTLILVTMASDSLGSVLAEEFGMKSTYYGDPSSDEFYSDGKDLPMKALAVSLFVVVLRGVYAVGMTARKK